MMLWDVDSLEKIQDGKPLWRFTGHKREITTVLFSPDGQRAVSGSRDGDIRYWQLPTTLGGNGPRVMSWPIAAPQALHTDAVTHLAASADGKKLLSYTSDKTLWFWQWDTDKNALRLAWKREFPRIESIALDPDGGQALLAILGNSQITQVDTKSQESKFTAGRYGATSIQISTDGRRYVVGDRDGGFTLFDWPGGAHLRDFAKRDHPIRQLRFSLDGKRILSIGSDKTVRLWDSGNSQELKRLPIMASDKAVIALAPDATRALLAHGEDHAVLVFDLSTLKIQTALKGHDEQVLALAFSPDGKSAVSAGRDRTLRVWNLATGKESARLDGHSGDVTCVSVTADGRHIISACRDKTLRIWPWPE